MGQLLLRGEPRILNALKHNPFPDKPPRFVRASAIAISPATKAERRATGAYWRTRRIGTVVEARERDDSLFEISIPEPEQFHPDWLGYKRRAAPLRAMVDAFAGGMPADQAVILGSDLRADEVEQFWREVVPAIAEARGDYARLAEVALGLRAKYGRAGVNRFERLLERFAWLLRQRTERHHFADATPKIPFESNFRYSMFLHDVVLDGREAFLALLADPTQAAARAEKSTDATQLWAVSVLRYDMMLHHIRSFRWFSIGKDCHELKLHGIFEYYPLMDAYVPPDEEWRPKFVKHPSGAHGVEGFYPDYPADQVTPA
jgi:hypothetical protein